VPRPSTITKRQHLRRDAVAGLVLGVESVPDGLASGLLAAVNPVFGLYAYMVGTFTGALFTSSMFMVVQATGAMAIIIADVDAVHGASDPERALFTLSVITGVVMLTAGILRLGSLLRFVSRAVMVGFISAVGVNIILGQFANFTGYDGEGANRVVRALDTLLNLGHADLATMVVGASTMALILFLERTRLGPLGLVLAIVLASAGALGLDSVARLADIADVPNALPRPMLPSLQLAPSLLIPALSLAFVGLVQGASISASTPNPDGKYPNASRDFVGQGAANVAAGIFQGVPVGGSVSATSMVTSAGARSKRALVIAAVVMAIVILLFAGLVSQIAMPSLAALLMIIGYRTIKPRTLESVWRSGTMQAAVVGVTFVLTMVIPLQYAVLVGVGLSVVLHIVQQSNRLTIRRLELTPTGDVIESDPPPAVPPNDVVILQPYGSLFFASAPMLEDGLPSVSKDTRNSVVILRLRGQTELGTTVIEVLRRFHANLVQASSRLVIVHTSDLVQRQLEVTGLAAALGSENVYRGTESVGATTRRIHEESLAWVRASTPGREVDDDPR
jgi:sulfate permease, SulP family